MQEPNMRLLPAVQVSNLYEYFQAIRDPNTDSSKFLKLLNKIHLNLHDVDKFLGAQLAEISTKKPAEGYTDEERQIIKLAKNILRQGACINMIGSESPLIANILSTMGIWGEFIQQIAAHQATACAEPPTKKPRHSERSVVQCSINDLPDDLLSIVCAYAEWMAALKLLSSTRHLYSFYKREQNNFMIGLRVINQTLTKVKTSLGEIDYQTLLQKQTHSHFGNVLTSPTYFELPDCFVFECIKKGLYKGIEEGNLEHKDFTGYLKMLACWHIEKETQNHYAKDLFHCIFPEACLRIDTSETLAHMFKDFSSKLKQERASIDAVDFRTGLLIEFITTLSLPADLGLLAWQVLGQRIDLGTAPDKWKLLNNLWHLAASKEYFPKLTSIQTEIITASASQSGSCASTVDMLDLNQALMGAYFSSPEKKLEAFQRIFAMALKGVWTLDLYQIEQLLNSWDSQDVRESNHNAYLGSWDLDDSYLISYCKAAELLLKILVVRFKMGDKETIKHLTRKICDHIQELIDIDLDIYEDEDAHSGHGSHGIDGNFGDILKLIDEIDPKRSLRLFESLKKLLPHILQEETCSATEIKDFTASILAWQSDEIYFFLNDLFKGKEEFFAPAIEQYSQYYPITALKLAYAYCPSPQIQIDLMAAILLKLDKSIPTEAAQIIEMTKKFVGTLKANKDIDPRKFIMNLACLDPMMALKIALGFQDENIRAFCSLKIMQKNQTRFNKPPQAPRLVEMLTKTTSVTQTMINQHVFNFIFKLSDTLREFRKTIHDVLQGKYPENQHNYPDIWFSSITTIASLYSALVETGMHPQELLKEIQEAADSLPDEDSQKGKLWHLLLEEGSILMGTKMKFAHKPWGGY